MEMEVLKKIESLDENSPKVIRKHHWFCHLEVEK